MQIEKFKRIVIKIGTSTLIDEKGKFKEQLVSCRENLNFILSRPENIDYIDVSPKQLVSVAASLIPCPYALFFSTTAILSFLICFSTKDKL